MLRTAGVDAMHLPYEGTAESTQAVTGKPVDFPLAVSSTKRHERLPKVPTLAEAGVPVAPAPMGGLSVPAGTPPPVVRRIPDTPKATLARPEVHARIRALGGNVAWSTPEGRAAALQAELGLTDRLMATGLEAQ